MFTYTDSMGGGVIPYTALDVDRLESFNVDTNMVAVAEDRVLIKAELDRQYNQMLAQEGPTRANAYRKDMNERLNTYSASEAFAARYGIRSPSRQPAMRRTRL